MNQSDSSLTNRAIFWMIATTVLWGGSFVFNKIAFRELHPLVFLFLRFSLASLLMALLSIGRIRKLDVALIWKGTVVGLFLALANISFVIGVNGTSVSRAGFLNNLFVLFIPLLTFLRWRDKPGGTVAAGVALASVGTFMLAQGGAEGFNRGDFVSLLCAVFIAGHIIAVSRMIREGDDIFLVTTVQFAVVALVGAALLPQAAMPLFPAIGMTTACALAYCVIFPTVICFLLQNKYQRFTTPAQAGVIYTLDPIWSMMGGYLFLHERLTASELGGCLLILAGVIVPFAVRLVWERVAVGAGQAPS